MTDIVERLRDGNNPSPFATRLEAADYIDQLRAEVAFLRRQDACYDLHSEEVDDD